MLAWAKSIGARSSLIALCPRVPLFDHLGSQPERQLAVEFVVLQHSHAGRVGAQIRPTSSVL